MLDEKIKVVLQAVVRNFQEALKGDEEMFRSRGGVVLSLEYLDSYLDERYDGEGKAELYSLSRMSHVLVNDVKNSGLTDDLILESEKLVKLYTELIQS